MRPDSVVKPVLPVQKLNNKKADIQRVSPKGEPTADNLPTAGAKVPEAEVYDVGWKNPADAVVSFRREVYDFGSLREGEAANTMFVFTNTSREPLEIETASACFCMTVNWTRDLIQPGQQANVDVVFDSNDQVGSVRKDIDLIFKNTDKEGYPLIKRLQIKGRVVAKN